MPERDSRAGLRQWKLSSVARWSNVGKKGCPACGEGHPLGRVVICTEPFEILVKITLISNMYKG
jgi:hypothetical protein